MWPREPPSAETSRLRLWGVGYKKHKLTPAREGSFVSVQFNGHMSGPFGRDLNPANWFDFNKISERYLDFARLKQRDERLALGWLDLHVTTSESIAEGCHAALPHQTGTQL